MSTLPTSSVTSAEVAEFLESLKPASAARVPGRGRLIFALDATASREPTWDRACRIQGEMFEATAALGGLATQPVREENDDALPVYQQRYVLFFGPALGFLCLSMLIPERRRRARPSGRRARQARNPDLSLSRNV